jgi:hypothetical protein
MDAPELAAAGAGFLVVRPARPADEALNGVLVAGPCLSADGATGRELEALRRLGMNVRRGRGYDADAPKWQAIDRLLQPLDDARDALWVPASSLHRRAVTDAVGLVLLRCAALRTAPPTGRGPMRSGHG